MKYNFTDGQSRVDALLAPEPKKRMQSKRKVRKIVSRVPTPPEWLDLVIIGFFFLGLVSMASGGIYAIWQQADQSNQKVQELEQRNKELQQRNKELQEKITTLTYYMTVAPEKTKKK